MMIALHYVKFIFLAFFSTHFMNAREVEILSFDSCPELKQSHIKAIDSHTQYMKCHLTQ